jgi:hypothetical protein
LSLSATATHQVLAPRVPHRRAPDEDERVPGRRGRQPRRLPRQLLGEPDLERRLGLRLRWQRLPLHRHRAQGPHIPGAQRLDRERPPAALQEGPVARAQPAQQQAVDQQTSRGQKVRRALESARLARSHPQEVGTATTTMQ